MGEGPGKGAFLRTFLPSILWMIIILVLCLLPKRDIETIDFSWLPKNADKVVHAGFYIILAILLSFAFIKYKFRFRKLLIITLTICAFYGFSIEVMQHYFTTTRHFELLDVLANSLGSVIGLIIFRVWFFLKLK
jgi:glycopeptide antibiotics resistance protein